jgi:hypothetical protein
MDVWVAHYERRCRPGPRAVSRSGGPTCSTGVATSALPPIAIRQAIGSSAVLRASTGSRVAGTQAVFYHDVNGLEPVDVFIDALPAKRGAFPESAWKWAMPPTREPAAA